MISAISLILAAAPFTPAVLCAFIMLPVAGIVGYCGAIQAALVLTLINSLSLIISPGINIGKTDTLLFVVSIMVIPFTGIILGLRKII
ncbi:hypothetical protein HR060_06480 [Catenovulum sp. SM1970]|nr:hypothetical protein [Marinifaba aquimaris]